MVRIMAAATAAAFWPRWPYVKFYIFITFKELGGVKKMTHPLFAACYFSLPKEMAKQDSTIRETNSFTSRGGRTLHDAPQASITGEFRRAAVRLEIGANVPERPYFVLRGRPFS